MNGNTEMGEPGAAGEARSPRASLVITFVSGALIGAGLYWAAGDLWSTSTKAGMDHGSMMKDGMKDGMAGGEMAHGGMPHAHGMLPVDDWANPPTIAADIFKDPESGWNLHVMTTNFAFNAAAAGYDNVEGEGHAHIYVNGDKLGRLYGDWYHIGGLSAGTHHVKVSLNANDHSALHRDGKELAAHVKITVE
jgi:hypothetical protein